VRVCLTTQPGQQGCKPGPSLIIQREKLHAQSVTSLGMPDHRFRLNLPFLHKEMKPDGMTNGLGDWSLQEEAARAEVADARDVLFPVASPKNPNVLRNSDA